MITLFEKYKPKCLGDIIGNKNQINEIIKWISTFDSSMPVLLIGGPPGVGKTATSLLALNEYNYKTIEINSSDLKGPKTLYEYLSKVLSYRNISEFFENKKIGVLLDEIDTLSSGGDKSALNELMHLLTPVKYRKKKMIGIKMLHIDNPIICTANYYKDKKMQAFKKYCKFIEFKNPTTHEIVEYIKYIMKNECISMEDDVMNLIAINSQGDIRQLFFILDDLVTYRCKKTIIMNDLDDALRGLSNKDLDIQLYDASAKILGSKITLDDIYIYHDYESLTLPLMIYENYFSNISKNRIGDISNKYASIKEITSGFSEWDVIHTKIFSSQSWDLCDYTPIHSIAISNYNLNIYNKKLSGSLYNNFTKVLNKQSLYYTNSKIKYNVLEPFDNIYSNNISYIIVNILGKYIKSNQYNKVCNFLKYYGLNEKYIDDLFKLNKFESIKKITLTTSIRSSISSNYG